MEEKMAKLKACWTTTYDAVPPVAKKNFKNLRRTDVGSELRTSV